MLFMVLVVLPVGAIFVAAFLGSIGVLGSTSPGGQYHQSSSWDSERKAWKGYYRIKDEFEWLQKDHARTVRELAEAKAALDVYQRAERCEREAKERQRKADAAADETRSQLRKMAGPYR